MFICVPGHVWEGARLDAAGWHHPTVERAHDQGRTDNRTDGRTDGGGGTFCEGERERHSQTDREMLYFGRGEVK